MKPLRFLLLIVMLGAGTMFLGWWAVPVIAAVYALLRRDITAPREAMLAALIAWLLLLARMAQFGAFTTLLDRLGRIFPMPGMGVFALALLLAMALAWSAARVVTGAAATSERGKAR